MAVSNTLLRLFSVFVLFSFSYSVSGKMEFSEKMILLEFKNSISDANGMLSSWKSNNSHHCSWFGVTCNSDSRVSGLNISGGNFARSASCSYKYSDFSLHGFGIERNCSAKQGKKLVGKLSPVIENLTELRVLSLPFNELSGELPSGIWGLKNLEVIDLEGNLISGNLSLFDFTCPRNLRVLNLGFNKIVGEIPNSLSKCRGLRVLNLAGNEVRGLIPGFVGSFQELKGLYLSFNRFVGSVPEELGKNCRDLEHIDFSGNFLKGKIPRNLGNCSQLRTMLLFSNSFHGVIPSDLGNLRKLEVIDMSRNKLRGPIPVNLGKCVNLSVLVLSSHFNQLSSTKKTTNEQGFFEYNSFEGSIPLEITMLPNLRLVWAPFANLRGKFPSNWGKCDKLETVNLVGNHFTGEISDVFRKCQNLHFLNVSSIRISEYNFSFNNLSGQKIPFLGSSLVATLSVPPSDQQAGIEPLNSSDSGNSNSGKNNKGFKSFERAIIISSSVIVVILLVLVTIFFYMRKWKPNPRVEISQQPSRIQDIVVFNDIGVQLTFDNVVQATGNFTSRNCIGNGGFGATYRAEVSPGTTVAVKRLTIEMYQGVPQFNAEIRTLGQIKHPNLITLIGYYASTSEMFLIYNYLSGGNLEQFIQERATRFFDLKILHKIALDVAKALAYLHDQCNPRILHRDVKPSNILLDNELNAYLSDFGLSRLLEAFESHVTTGVAGTFGYVAPEYALTCRVSDKADVYSYGVVLLELISNKRALDPSFSSQANGFMIVSWALMLLQAGEVKEVFASNLWDVGPENVLVEMLELAIICTSESVSARPTMRQVVRRLKQLQTNLQLQV